MQYPFPPGSLQAQPIDEIVNEVAGLLGLADDDEVRTVSIRSIDRAAAHMNMFGIWVYTLTEVTYDTFTDDQTQLTLPDDWGWPYGPARMLDGNGALKGQIAWCDWETFNSFRNVPPAAQPAWPQGITIRSEADGYATISPSLSSSFDGSIVLPYLRRVKRISEVADTNELVLTDEMRECLVAGGQAFLMQFRYKDRPPIWLPYREMFVTTIRGARGAAGRRQYPQHGWARVRRMA